MVFFCFFLIFFLVLMALKVKVTVSRTPKVDWKDALDHATLKGETLQAPFRNGREI